MLLLVETVNTRVLKPQRDNKEQIRTIILPTLPMPSTSIVTYTKNKWLIRSNISCLTASLSLSSMNHARAWSLFSIYSRSPVHGSKILYKPACGLQFFFLLWHATNVQVITPSRPTTNTCIQLQT